MSMDFRTGVSPLVAAVGLCLSSGARAALDDVVFVMGKSSDTPIAQAQMFGTVELDIPRVCRTLNTVMMMADMALPAEVRNYLYLETPYTGEGFDCSRAERQPGKYAIVYTSCSMVMTDGTYLMRWTVPPDAPEAQMVIVDVQKREFVEGSMLETELGMVDSSAKGRELSQSVKPGSGSRSFDLLVETGTPDDFTSSMKTFTGQEYIYEYSGEISMAGMAEAGLSLGNMQSNGTAYLSPEVPGSDVVAKFYENFKTYVTPATESGTLLTSMIEQMSDVVSHGMPLQTEQTVTMGVAGMGLGRFGAGNTSTSEMQAVAVWEGGATAVNACGNMQPPEGFTVSNLDEMMSGGAPAMSAEDAEQVNEALGEAAKAMEQMTPEQKQMMESMGLGDMMNQMLGGAAAAGAGSAAATKSGSAMPPADELEGGNVTASVQKHLQALGYDVGNTNGEMSMETTIAISTFQAEKGMEVTGEPSPQLLGVLSAEVDSRR
jgi:hypothetical protein